MVKIPSYDASSSVPTSPQINPSMASAGGEMLSEAGKGLEGIADHFLELQHQHETTQAKIQLSKKFEEIQNKALLDPDLYEAGDKAEKERQQAINDSSKLISSREAAGAFSDSAAMEAENHRVSLDVQLKKKQIDTAKVDTLQLIKQREEEYYKGNPAERVQKKSEIKDEVDTAIAKGIFDKEAGMALVDATFKDMALEQVNRDVLTDLRSGDPVEAMKQTKADFLSGKDGMYSDITDPVERTEVEAKINSGIKTATATEKAQKGLTHHVASQQAAWLYVNKGLTQDWLEENRTTLAPGEYKGYSEKILSGGIEQAPNADVFEKTMKFVSDPKNSEADCVNKLMESKLNPDQLRTIGKHFMTSPDDDPMFKLPARPNLESIVEAKTQRDSKFKEKQDYIAANSGWWHQQFGGDKEKYAGYVKDVQEEMDKNGWKDFDKLSVATDNVIRKENLKQNPSLKNVAKEGALFYNAFGIKVRGYSDGRIIPVPNQPITSFDDFSKQEPAETPADEEVTPAETEK